VAIEDLTRGLDHLLGSHGFVVAFANAPRHNGSYETATWSRGDRRVLLASRYAVSVGYRIGELGIEHGAYMRAMLGPGGGNRFPTFGHDAEVSVAAIVHDLREYGHDFLAGEGAEFKRLVGEASSHPQKSGFARLAAIEQQLRDR
jgi:hypothetical protein